MISVIIPTYNRKDILPRAINSVLNQTFQDFEIIVIDDGSSDGTAALFEKDFKNNRIRFDRLSSNQGVHIARNRGIELARGDLLVFLDSDDELFPNALEIGQKISTVDQTIGVFIAPYQTDDGELTSFDRSAPGIISYEDLLCECSFRRKKESFAIIRTSVLDDIRWVMQNLDFIFFRKLARKTKIYFWPKPLAICHLSESGISLHKERKVPNVGLSIRRGQVLANFLKEFGQDILKFCHTKYSDYAYGAAIGLLLNGQKQQALELARLSMKYNTKRSRYMFFYWFVRLPLSSFILRLLFKLKGLFMKMK
jgi:glycosyltransferase involved in cell wall biosynthesis